VEVVNVGIELVGIIAASTAVTVGTRKGIVIERTVLPADLLPLAVVEPQIEER
jgi:hypothetical protein